MPLALLDERDVDGQRDVVGQRVAAVGERHVPIEAEAGAIDDRLQLQVRAGVAEGVGARGGPRAGRGHGLRRVADRQVADDRRGAVLAQVEVVGDERDLRELVGREEVVAEDVGAELLRRADRDRLDLRGAISLPSMQGVAVTSGRPAEVDACWWAKRETGINGSLMAGERSGGGAHVWLPSEEVVVS